MLDLLLEYWLVFWNFIKDGGNSAGVVAIITILGVIVAVIAWFFGLFGKSKTDSAGQIPDPGNSGKPVLTFTPKQYKEHITEEIAEAEASLQSAHDAEKARLQQKIEELRKRAADPEKALQQARETIAKLEEALEREGNEIGDSRMSEARKALEAGDFSIADKIFAEIEDREQLAVERTARAAFARGEIAEQEIRWHDAAKHYTRAARLHPTFDNLKSASEFASRSGDFDNALTLGTELVEVAETEFGKTHEEYAEALNQQALTLAATGKYDQAEVLYNEAIEIDKQTIGEKHPDYAIHLNNLAELYRTTSKYDLAEPLYIEAIEIAKQTIGENHPDYATDLNNLAALYRTTDNYDLAEPLYKEAIGIFEATLGPDHPNTKAGKASYEDFLKTRP